MSAAVKPRTLTTKLRKWPQGVALVLAEQTARASGLLAGAPVRVILLDNEIRIRRVSVPCVDDYETYEQYQVRIAQEDAERHLPDESAEQ